MSKIIETPNISHLQYETDHTKSHINKYKHIYVHNTIDSYNKV